MHALRAACLLGLALVVGAEPPEPPATTRPEPEPPRRIIVEVNRDQFVKGFLRSESRDSLILETLAGELEHFSKSRVLSIVRLVDPEPGQAGIVVLRTGRRHEGVIVEDGFERVVVETDGIRTTHPRRTVDRVILAPSFAERYARFKQAAVSPEQRLDLARWLIREHRYELAREELETLVAESPSAGAQRLLTIVAAQLALDPGAPRDAAPAGGGPGARPRADAAPLKILTAEDVNLIRVYEIDFDRPPKVSVPAETIRTMIERYAARNEIPAAEAERRALYRADAVDIVELLFRLRARELYPQVNVLTEPYALNLFRRRVHNAWLLNSCATVSCHGRPGAGRFFLHRDRYKDERVRYTNFLILERLEVDPGWPLVDYDEPMMSLIIQYGLPRQSARMPHPDVRGWKPVFTGAGRRMLEDATAWIDAMMKPRPDYPVEYQPPPAADVDAADAGGEGVFPDLDERSRTPR